MEASSFVPNRPTLDGPESFTVVSSSSSTKRRHHHYNQPPSSSAQTFRQPPAPPIKLSSGEALFRILCPATKTGGVIGKGGSIIRQLREDTGAKIRIDDPIPGCEERVILIVAAHSTTKKKDKDKGTSSSYASAAAVEEVKQTVVDTSREEAEELLKNSTSNLNFEEQEEEEEEEEVVESPAQQALLRIFERILKVKEERSSGESNKISSSDNDNNKECGVSVVCRLLAPSSQIGSVLGKGGKIIERIRHDSGAHVRVLHHDLLPPCSSPGDELIQITGKFSAVRKAVLSVSGCLQDHSRGDGPNSAIKSLGIPLHGTGTENSWMVLEEVVFKLLCQVDKVGSLIGKGGSVIRVLQNDTGASIKIADAAPDSDERVVIISAREA
ncbi:hypothetical protein LguiA_010130 [Lonicera macranthoides]